ncbi:MAG TPA: cysteine--tRNA ligase [Anaerovoracaceae bacterium]|nr:cysteine--tRNA ligase [Anaerovoracaceae bacterium]
MKIYNTLTRRKEEFIPMDENEIKIYVCGPTVYNYFHIGNARPFVVFDTLRKYLEYRGKTVKFIQNFTDIDDKIINKAKEDGVSAKEISEKYIEEYFKDAAALNVDSATVHPKVTENIEEIIEFVKTLVEKGYAYETNGDVYFSARSFSDYGKLSGQKIEDLESGSRIMVDEKKADPLDFALWKARKNDNEIAWESPWGVGRPGWHIECSVMSTKYLGETIDIHAGGQDLTFPHHENEIAQSEAATGKPFANYWMHNGYITIDNEKMSKSKGNFFTVRDILDNYGGEVIRFFLLSGHYRNPINFSEDLMEQSKNSLARMQNAKITLKHLIENESGDITSEERQRLKELDGFREKFIEAMDDDLNTADAISAIFEMIKQINTYIKDGCSKGFAKECLSLLDELTEVLGLLSDNEEETVGVEAKTEIDLLIEERQEARLKKDFKRADEIRDLLKEKGIILKDTPQGVQIIKE